MNENDSAVEQRLGQLEKAHADLLETTRLLRAQMGETKPFSPAQVGAYMSHFLITMEILAGKLAGTTFSIVSPLAAQTVSWSDPFVYNGTAASHQVQLPLPSGCGLPGTIKEDDFFDRPAEYFQVGRQTVWLQILNLDATMETAYGRIRITLGETLRHENPELFVPSLGAAQSLGTEGFPARLFFNPVALVETPFGSFRATHGVLSYGRVVGFPPIGTPVTTSAIVPMEPIPELKAALARAGGHRDATGALITVEPHGRIVALSHPIDMPLHLVGDEAFNFVEAAIRRNTP